MDQRTQPHQKAFGGVAEKVPSEGEGRSQSIIFKDGILAVDRLKQRTQAVGWREDGSVCCVAVFKGTETHLFDDDWWFLDPKGNVRC